MAQKDLGLNLVQVDLGNHKREKINADLNQIKIDLNLYKKNEGKHIGKFLDSSITCVERKIEEHLKKCSKESKVIVFPEVSIPQKMIKKLRDYSIKNRTYIIGGLEYDDNNQNMSIVLTPNGDIFKSPKHNTSKYDHKSMRPGNYLHYFVNSGFGDFAVLVCYDFIDRKILDQIRERVDIIFVLAFNPAKTFFQKRAQIDCWDTYSYVLITNTANHGKTCGYYPAKNSKEAELGIESRKKDTILSIEIDTEQFYKSPNNLRDKPNNYSRKKIKPNEPSLGFSLVDWPYAFADNSVIILGDSYDRAISELRVNSDTMSKIKQIDPEFGKILEKYITKKERFHQAKPIDAILLPKLTYKLFQNSIVKKLPDTYLDTMVLPNSTNKKTQNILKEHNIISIGNPGVNAISREINKNLECDKNIFATIDKTGNNVIAIFDEKKGGNIYPIKRGLGIIGLTKNPWNSNLMAIMIGGIQWYGTLAALKYLIENEGNAFAKSPYGLTGYGTKHTKPQNFLYDDMEFRI